MPVFAAEDLHPTMAAFDERIDAHIHTDQYVEALAASEERLQAAIEQFGERSEEAGWSLNRIGLLRWKMSEYAQAQADYLLAFEILSEVFDAPHARVGVVLSNIGNLYLETGHFEPALLWLQPAVAELSAANGEHDELTALALTNLGVTYHHLGDNQRAQETLQQALTSFMYSVGMNHPSVMHAFNGLGLVTLEMGQYDQAILHFQSAVDLIIRNYGEEHSLIVNPLSNIAAIYFQMGDFDKAAETLVRTSNISRAVYGEDHPATIQLLHNLGMLFAATQNLTEAEAVYKEVLARSARVHGPQDVATLLYQDGYGRLLFAQDRLEEAEQVFLECLEGRRKVLGEDHPDTVNTMEALANVYARNGDYAKAEALSTETLTLTRERYGDEHAEVATSLYFNAALQVWRGNYSKAIEFYRESFAVQEAVIDTMFQIADDEQKLAYIRSISEPYMSYISFLYQKAVDNPAALRVGLELVSARKGIVLDAQASKRAIDNANIYKSDPRPESEEEAGNETLSTADAVKTEEQAQAIAAMMMQAALMGDMDYEAVAARAEQMQADFDATDPMLVEDATVEQVAHANSQAERTSAKSEGDSPAGSFFDRVSGLQPYQDTTAIQASLDSLDAIKDSASPVLESDSVAEAVASPSLFEQLVAAEKASHRRKRVVLSVIARSLTEGTVFIEFLKAYLSDWDSRELDLSIRYLAFVLYPDESIKLIDLGAAEDIEAKVTEELGHITREIFDKADARKQEAAARRLHALLWEPLEEAVRDTEQVILGTDGVLNLVPFSALLDAAGKYLVESKTISYVTSGRDLGRETILVEHETALFLAANPQYDKGATITLPRNSASAGDRGIVLRSVDFNAQFAPLPGTASEAESIPGLIEGANKVVVTGEEATEAAVLAVEHPKILHIATHGFFLEAQADGIYPENPLLRSGLAFAGANQVRESSDNFEGILTAFEASGMDLVGTELVTLSACQTGVGEVSDGEGVYGLRRAFALAGARNLLMSLWSVSDTITAEQMTQFYRLYGEGADPAVALRQAQLSTIASLRKEYDSAPPSLWSAFILQGARVAK